MTPATGPQAPTRDERWFRIQRLSLEYVGAGWFLTQVVAVLSRRLGWPDGVSDALVIALGVGFVLVLATSIFMSRRPRPTKRSRRFFLAGTLAASGLVIWFLTGGQPDVQSGEFGYVMESRGLFSASTDIDGFFIVHPQEPLLHTGIRLNPGQTVAAWGDGRINIGLARLVEAAQEGENGAYEWVGPSGEIDARGMPQLRPDRGKPGRERCLVHEGFPYGALLLLIAPSERITPGSARRLEADAGVFLVGDHIEATTSAGGFVTLAVNDVYLDDEACDPEWQAEGRDPAAFFDDNIGFFSARVQVR